MNSTGKAAKSAKKHELLSKLPIAKYARGSIHLNTKTPNNKFIKEKVHRLKSQIVEAAEHTSAAEVLLPAESGGIELDDPTRKVYKLKHAEILGNVDLNTSRNAFNFQLHDFGPYFIDFSRNGRFLLFGGRRGHVATYDCQYMEVVSELQLQQDVFDVQFLHNETMFAVAQRKCVYIYDRNGVEIHCMKRHERPFKLEYLPYHYLLASVGQSGVVRWHDVSTGDFVAGHQTGLGPCHVLRQNPHNAVLHAGHSNGVVSLWAPSTGKALASIFCHKSPVTDVAVDRSGHYMATAGLDGFLKLWDLRKMDYLHSFRLDRPATSLDFSDKGVLGVGLGREVQLLRDAFIRPYDVTYLHYEIPAPNSTLSSGAAAVAATRALQSRVSVSSVRFRPLEDIVTAGHSHGIAAFVAPGTGEPNFDSFEANPFSSTKQRREAEVQGLLNKLSSDMIALDTDYVGGVDKSDQLQQEQQEAFGKAKNSEQPKKEKDRKRGRNKISAKLRRRQKNVIDEQMVKFQEAKKKQAEQQKAASEVSAAGTALARFVRTTQA